MAWVVDTCVLIDILEGDPEFGLHSATALDARAHQGLLVCPVTFVELSPCFDGNIRLQEEFLQGVGCHFFEHWLWADTCAAHTGWAHQARARRSGHSRRRPVADLLIGAFASRHDGLITRNSVDFRVLYPQLQVIDPMDGKV
jgi:predicted nucleic acid-binding protein